jgi:hypothetical protein
MSTLIELYTAEAVVTGYRVDRAAVRETLETGDAVRLAQPQWTPLHRAPDERDTGESLPVDEVLAAVAEPDPHRAVHANWHDVVLESGPYRISGTLAVLPGFDPNRAITRPGGTFIPLRAARLEIIDYPDAGQLDRETVLVNRYAVDRVASTLELGFFFPAARIEQLEQAPVA